LAERRAQHQAVLLPRLCSARAVRGPQILIRLVEAGAPAREERQPHALFIEASRRQRKKPFESGRFSEVIYAHDLFCETIAAGQLDLGHRSPPRLDADHGRYENALVSADYPERNWRMGEAMVARRSV
jgi:hypothetical protein